MAKSKMAVRTPAKQTRFGFVGISLIGERLGRLFRLGGVLTLLALMGILLQLGYSSWQQTWPVKNILLEGNYHYLNKQELVALVNDKSSGGMLSIDLQKLQADAKLLDWIDRVEIRKVWPDTLLFLVQEHQPVVRIDELILTQKGTLIEKNKPHAGLSELPHITTSQHATIGEQNYPQIWQEFKQIRRKLELLELNVERLEIDQLRNWRLLANSGVLVNLGRKERLSRVDKLVLVYSDIADKTAIESIDLRYHNGLAVKWSRQSEKLKS